AAVADLDLAGYLIWNDVNEQTLVPFLMVLLTGRVLMCSRQALHALLPADFAQPPEKTDLCGMLTERERTILRSLAAGHTQDEIAHEISQSVRTVKRVVADVQEKLGVRGPVALGMRIHELGLAV